MALWLRNSHPVAKKKLQLVTSSSSKPTNLLAAAQTDQTTTICEIIQRIPFAQTKCLQKIRYSQRQAFLLRFLGGGTATPILGKLGTPAHQMWLWLDKPLISIFKTRSHCALMNSASQVIRKSVWSIAYRQAFLQACFSLLFIDQNNAIF